MVERFAAVVLEDFQAESATAEAVPGVAAAVREGETIPVDGIEETSAPERVFSA